MLDGKVAIITGGASGIGKAIVTTLLKQQASVAVFDANAEKNAQVAKDFPDAYNNGRLRIYQVDVSRMEQCIQSVDKVMSDFHRIDILTNNAGIQFSPDEGYSSLTAAQDRGIFEVNYWGAYNCFNAALPYLLQRRYRQRVVINITSTQGAGKVDVGFATAYNATKAALATQTKVWAKEYAKDNIRVCAVAPGAIATRDGGMGDIKDPDAIRRLRKRIPLGRSGHPYEVANVVAFLASPFASYVTGVEWIVDGGFTAHGGDYAAEEDRPVGDNDPYRDIAP